MSAVAVGVFEAAWTVCPAEYHRVGVAEVEGVVWVHASAAAWAWGAGDEVGELPDLVLTVRVAVHNGGHGPASCVLPGLCAALSVGVASVKLEAVRQVWDDANMAQDAALAEHSCPTPCTGDPWDLWTCHCGKRWVLDRPITATWGGLYAWRPAGGDGAASAGWVK